LAIGLKENNINTAKPNTSNFLISTSFV